MNILGLTVYAGAERVGEIEGRADGPRLIYDSDWLARADAFPISLSMPLVRREWDADIVTPWLMNLLPEGEPLRAVARKLGVAREDVLGLIANTGRDIAGALSIGSARAAASPGLHRIKTPDDLERIINELPARPFLAGEDGISMSLAGAQEKLPLAVDGEVLAIAVNGAPSTHILKPDNDRLPGSVQNEALCMTLARRIGLEAAPIATGVAGKRSYLLVTRFDRVHGEGGVRRLHQEDFCQALGLPPAAKYQHNSVGASGPSLGDMFALAREHMLATDINRLLDAVIFNIAIGNVDSHAKNYSILLAGQSASLAPLYDLMSGLVWDGITQNHAQEVGGQRRGRHIYGRHWKRMAAETGLGPAATIGRVEQVAGRILAQLPAAVAEVEAMPAGGHPLLKALADQIEERARLVQNHARLDSDPGADPAVTGAPHAPERRYES